MDSSYSEIWTPYPDEESYKFKVRDTTEHSVSLIFEREFNDSIEVFCNEKKIISRKMKTNKFSSVVESEDEFRVDYKPCNDPVLTIYMTGKKRKVQLKVMHGYKICYITRILDIWGFHFSNYMRIYY